jgi:phosphatidylserine/phosphatidylglycerophosphate/cardiolipin synthase-like enzyme
LPGINPPASTVKARAYASPTVVLLAMDWPDGSKFDDFLGFAILRSPGFAPGEKEAYLRNKIGFDPPTAKSQPLPSNLAPFQKFFWWDSGINTADRGQTFRYTITPVRGTGGHDLHLQHQDEATVTVNIPTIERDGIYTWFNRAVVSSQSFANQFPDPQKKLDQAMQWLANGLEDAIPEILKGATEVAGAIYHLTDNEWVMPELTKFGGALSIVYEDRPDDRTDRPAIDILKRSRQRFVGKPRSKTNIMHDKFLVDVRSGRVLTGSANFTPEGLTSQANLLHIFNSPALAKLYQDRQALIAGDPPIPQTAKGAAWSKPIRVGKASVRVFFSPEPTGQRTSIDTVVKAVQNAKSSVVFCMFDPTDPPLLEALLAAGDKGKLLYGMLNSISDPSKAKPKKAATAHAGEAPLAPSAATKIKVTLFNRSRKDKKVLAYSYFMRTNAPAGFLPELSTVDMTTKSTLVPAKTAKGQKSHVPPAVHIHHKFIVIDGESTHPTIYTGSANLSENSTHKNDENLLEITGSPELAQTYFAEFMRLYQHYRARALWNMSHPLNKGGTKTTARTPSVDGKLAKTFTLRTKRDEWVRDAYKGGTQAYLERTRLV